MCSRYYIKHKMYEHLPAFLMPADAARYEGDIRPSEKALIIRKGVKGMEAADFSWGYPSKENGLVINARAETLHDKPMFSEDVMKRRCLIPASGFYEWDKTKQKATVSVPGQEVVYFAGIYGIRSGEERFVIITRDSAGEMLRIHERMPLIIPSQRLDEWLSDDYRDVLSAEALPLEVYVENEQLSFL